MVIGISNAYFYFHWCLKRTDIKIINVNPQTLMY